MNLIHKFTCNPQQLHTMIQRLTLHNTPPIIDYIKEKHDINNFIEIQNKIIQYPKHSFAIKLSSLGIHESEMDCSIKLEKLIYEAKQSNSRLLIDAEEHNIQHKIDDMTDYYMKQYNKDIPLIFKTYQMYKLDSQSKLFIDLQKSRDYKIGVKLVRGAYLQQDKDKNILCNSENETHQQYDQGIKDFVSQHKKGDILLCATHNHRSIHLARYYIDKHNLNNIEFAQLLGMSDNITNILEKNGYKTYKYLPYGHLYDSIPYLLRRLYENYPMIRYINIL